MGFDDDTEQYEVMFGLIHGIEHLYKENIGAGTTFTSLKLFQIVIDRAERMDGSFTL